MTQLKQEPEGLEHCAAGVLSTAPGVALLAGLHSASAAQGSPSHVSKLLNSIRGPQGMHAADRTCILGLDSPYKYIQTHARHAAADLRQCAVPAT